MNSEEQRRFDWIKSVYGDWEEHKFMIQMVERLDERVKELLKLPSISAPDDWLAEIERLKNVLRLVQRWGKDSRSVGAWEVFQEVAKVLDPVTEQPVVVVDCTCIPCICFEPHRVVLHSLCLGCGARTCLAHELVKEGSR